MTALELLTDLRGRGVTLWVDGADLRFSAPKGALGSGAKDLLARHKAELVRLLKPAPENDASSRPQSNGASGASLDNQVIALSSVTDWCAEDQGPYVRYVAPYRGFLYQRLGLDKTFVRGQGCYLFDKDGIGYADFVAQFGAVPFGHDPEPIWQALEGARREGRPNLAIVSISEPAGELAEQLLAIAPPGFAHVVFTNSGAEAVEAAIKLARSSTGRMGILSTRNGFHGLTLAAMSATGREVFQRGFGAPVPGFDYVPFADLAALEATLSLRPDFFAAFMVEVIQGESGIRVAPPGYLAAARDLCHRFGVLLIIDEVQTGLGRTGTLFACETEGVTPDILILAKALGGGLISIGACLYTRGVFSERFDLRHGSTFAGNLLACRAALATLHQLTKDDHGLVRQVAATGAYLHEQLRQLQSRYPLLVGDIRGRGLMLGVELNLSHVAETQTGLLAMLQEQGLLLYLAVSFLLNVEHVRVAPSLSHEQVLRIEPPLTADTPLCDRLINALKRLLDALERGDAGELIGHLMEGPRPATPCRSLGPKRHQPASVPSPQPRREGGGARFAFIVHLLGVDDLRHFDASLGAFSDRQLDGLKSRIAPFVRPSPHDELAVQSADGSLAEGELIMLPHLPSELLALPVSEALELVQSAVDLAVKRGAEVVGLGGFSSIIALGGLGLRTQAGVSVTSGNSLTAWAAVRAIEAACAKHGVDLADCTMAVVGATGAIGHAVSLLCAEHVGELILVGNPRSAENSLGKLQEVADDCKRHAARLAASEPAVTITTDIDRHLPRAHIVLTATNAVAPFIAARHLRDGAFVCDIARPYNISPGLAAERPDLRLVGGGLVEAPPASRLGHVEDRERPNTLVACAAETIVLALSGFRSDHLCGRLDVTTIKNLGGLAERLGFSAAD
jgi:acetylornithine/succinyldiaminopimelate/putrescine aminotransferase/predicted amino acid dehydrogenase